MTIPVHFVGSIALDTPDEVFAAAGELLGPHLKRVPDGEPGGRRLWISFQVPVLRANPDLEVLGSDPTLGLIPLKLRDGVRPDDLHFGELGYSREARTSASTSATATLTPRISSSRRMPRSWWRWPT